MDFFVLALPVSPRMPIPRYVYTCVRVYVCVLASLIPRASNVTGPRCRPIVLYAMVLGIVSVSYRARVSCVPFVVHRGVVRTTRHRGVMNAWNLSMDAAPMINRACASYRTRGPFLSKRERGGKKSEGTQPQRNVFLRRAPTVYIAIPPRWQIGSRFYTRNAPRARTDREYEIEASWKSFASPFPPLPSFPVFIFLPFNSFSFILFLLFPHWFPFIWGEFSGPFNATKVVCNVIRESVCGTSE